MKYYSLLLDFRRSWRSVTRNKHLGPLYQTTCYRIKKICPTNCWEKPLSVSSQVLSLECSIKERARRICWQWQQLYLNLSLPRVINFKNFPCSLTRNITSHSMKTLAFHGLLRSQMITLPLLTTSLIHLSLKGCENVLFELGSVGLH